jgi:hypothetical protein
MVLHCCRYTIPAIESVDDSIYHVIAYCRLHFPVGLVVAWIIETLLNRILKRIFIIKFDSFNFRKAIL